MAAGTKCLLDAPLYLRPEDDGDHERCLAPTIRRARVPQRPVYVHAKAGIVDDRWVTLGSANLNAHSFYTTAKSTWSPAARRSRRQPTANVGRPSRTRRVAVAGDPD